MHACAHCWVMWLLALSEVNGSACASLLDRQSRVQSVAKSLPPADGPCRCAQLTDTYCLLSLNCSTTLFNLNIYATLL